MCLSTLWTEERKNAWLAKKPDTITVYKVMLLNSISKRYHPPIKGNKPFRAGVNKTRNTRIPQGMRYRPLYHCYISKSRAAEWFTIDRTAYPIVECTVQKRHITDMGFQDGVVIVASQITCPKYIGGKL